MTSSIDYRELVHKYNKNTGVPSALLLRIIEVESGGDPLAESPVGARGLFQLMPIAVKEARTACPKLKKDLDLFDPDTNVKVAMCFLKAIRPYWKTYEELLAFYNGGFKSRDAVRAGKKPPYKETRRYLLKFKEFL